MLKDFFKPLTLKAVTKIKDDGGSWTTSESTSTIYGLVVNLTIDETVKSKQLGIEATAKLFTEETLVEENVVTYKDLNYAVVPIPSDAIVNDDFNVYFLKRTA